MYIIFLAVIFKHAIVGSLVTVSFVWLIHTCIFVQCFNFCEMLSIDICCISCRTMSLCAGGWWQWLWDRRISIWWHRLRYWPWWEWGSNQRCWGRRWREKKTTSYHKSIQGLYKCYPVFIICQSVIVCSKFLEIYLYCHIIVIWPTVICFADWSKRHHVTLSIIEWSTCHSRPCVIIMTNGHVTFTKCKHKIYSTS